MTCFDQHNPNTNSGLNNLKASLGEFKLENHKQDVLEMLDDMLVMLNTIFMAR